VPTETGGTTQLGALTWIPGTTSLWAGGQLFLPDGNDVIGDTLKYGA
jgi:hypothetical protein